MESEPLLQKRADGKVLVIVTEEGLLGAVINSETLVVTNVSADSIAAAAGLQAGDRIVRITGTKANICIGDDKIVPGTKFYSAVHKALLQRCNSSLSVEQLCRRRLRTTLIKPVTRSLSAQIKPLTRSLSAEQVRRRRCRITLIKP